jgi:membrane protein implicated in regulation of membrane protease activity
VSLRRIAILSLVPAALLGAAVLAGLAWIALRAALAIGAIEAGLLAWVLAFVVGLPLALPVLALARRRPSRIRERKSRGRDNHFPLPHRGAP